jgi:MFS superfamily sulfate permease-like transporter
MGTRAAKENTSRAAGRNSAAKHDVIRELQQRGVRVLLTGANPTVRTKLEKAGVLSLLAPSGNFSTFEEAPGSVPEGR